MEKKGKRLHGAGGQEKVFDKKQCIVIEVRMIKGVMKRNIQLST